jgi:hypothetical protein
MEIETKKVENLDMDPERNPLNNDNGARPDAQAEGVVFKDFIFIRSVFFCRRNSN